MSRIQSLKKALELIILLFFLIFSPHLLAQDTPNNGVWSLEACIQYAVKNNIGVQQSDLQVQISENNYLQSKISRAPDLNAFASQNFNWGRSIDPSSNDFVNQRVSSNNFNLSSSVTLFDGFRINNTIKQNAVAVKVGRLDAQQTRYDLSLNVALAYLNILQNQELLAVAEQNVLSTQEQLERTRKLFEAGAVAQNDVIDLEATLANNELAVVDAQNQLQISKVNLQQFMNLEIRPDFEIESVPIESLDVSPVVESAENIYQTAESTQPNIQSAELSVEQNQYALEVAKAGRYPTLTLSGNLSSIYSSASAESVPTEFFGVERVGFVNGDPALPVLDTFNFEGFISNSDYPFLDQLGDNFRQQVSLSLNIPIFNRWLTKSNITNAKINRRISELNAQNVKLQLRQTIEQAYVDAKAAVNTYRARQKQVESLELAFITTEKRYNAGAANIVDYNLARINRDNARSDLVRAKYDYLFRQKVLDFYQGKDLGFE